jgi:hypothetical protein
MSDRLALIAILEALEVGDIGLIGSIVLGALEDGLRPEGVCCERCGTRADWPGLLDTHRCSGYFDHQHDDYFEDGGDPEPEFFDPEEWWAA